MTDKNLLQTSIELIDKIEKQNDEYFSRQMASYSRIFSELEDLKRLIQKENEQKMISVDEILKHCRRFEKVFKVKIIYINYETGVIIYIECGIKKKTSIAKIEEWWHDEGVNYDNELYVTDIEKKRIMEANDNDR